MKHERWNTQLERRVRGCESENWGEIKRRMTLDFSRPKLTLTRKAIEWMKQKQIHESKRIEKLIVSEFKIEKN